MARILVIDDESNIRMMLKIALTHGGHEVDTAADGFGGLEKFGTGADWDLILLDQRMPGMEGLEVLREMRKRSQVPRVLMITAFGTIDLALEAMTDGATDFLRKPFRLETLRAAVKAALEGRPNDSSQEAASVLPYSFDLTTVNGFRLHSAPGIQTSEGAISDQFTVQSAAGTEQTCRVVLPPYMVELVKAHADLETMPGGESFWQALCGEVLANHLWQNAEMPAGGVLTVENLTSGLRHWIDAVLSAETVAR